LEQTFLLKETISRQRLGLGLVDASHGLT
jgi:hypothetical protein